MEGMKPFKRAGTARLRSTAVFAVVLYLAAADCFPAAAGTAIDRVKIRLRVEEFDSRGRPVLEGWTDSDAYTVVEVRAAAGWEQAEGPGRAGQEGTEAQQETEEEDDTGGGYCYEIELAAEEENTFSVMEQPDIVFAGEKAVCTEALRLTGAQTLILTAELLEPGEIVGTVEKAWFEGTRACWEAAPNTRTYLIMLYRNSDRVGLPHRTGGLSYDFAPLMREAGSYHFKVFPLRESGKKGKETVSSRLSVPADLEDKVVNGQLQMLLSAAGAPEQQPQTEQTTGAALSGSGWVKVGDDWYYVEKDGTYPQENWLEIDGEWYYFDGTGKVKKNGWQQWKGLQYYLGDDGRIEKTQ